MKISACIIAKNEEENLPRLLESIKGKFDEIILVDTGSTDRTVEIAKSYGCKVYHRKWKGFADARNYAVSKAKGEWIWHFDADFELEEQEWRKALFYLKHLPQTIDAVAILIKNISSGMEDAGISSNTFIHRNKPNIKWVGKVHETVNVSESAGIPVFVKHYGYQSYENLKNKANRNLKLLEQELKEIDKSSKEYFIKLFYLVQSYSILAIQKPEYWKKVIKYAEEFISNSAEKIKFFSSYIYVYLVRALISEKRFSDAKERIKEAKRQFPDHPDIIFLEGELYTEIKDYDRAVDSFLKFITLIDKHIDNPFAITKGSAFVSDRLSNIMYYIENQIPQIINKSSKYSLEKLINIWKEKRGEYLSILILNVAISQNKEINRFVKKVVNLYNKPRVLSQAVVYADRMNDKKLKEKLLKRLEKIDPQNPAFMYFEGEEAFRNKNFEKALKMYSGYLNKTSNINIIPKIRKCLINLGFTEEAKRLDEKINNLSKKLKNASDNRTQQKQNRR